MTRTPTVIVLILAGLACSGCAIGKLVGGMMQNEEYQKLKETHAVYDGLENKRVAVLIDVDMVTLYEHPEIAVSLATNVARRIATNVPGVTVISPRQVSEWQFRTPQWNTVPYSEICQRLNVDRLVHIDIYEFRLHPPGNQWLWDGVCSANIGIIENDGFDPDNYADMFNISVAFPDMTGVTRENATAKGVKHGLLTLFTRQTSWLFFTHLEPKHPKYYQGPIQDGRYDGN